MMEDRLILVDLFDQEIGQGPKIKVHEEGKLHRAFSVFLKDGNKMLIQRRNEGKYHSGGLWANACCSHPRAGESLSEATKRRLMFELGINCEVEELFSFVYYTKFSDSMHEYEYDHVFIGDYKGPVKFDPEEISEVAWVDMDWLKEDLLIHPDRYCSWFLIAAPKVLSILGGK